MTIVAYMTCCWCGRPTSCTVVPDVGWVCSQCRPAAEGPRVYPVAA